jgi:hypothetical protein
MFHVEHLTSLELAWLMLGIAALVALFALTRDNGGF